MLQITLGAILVISAVLFIAISAVSAGVIFRLYARDTRQTHLLFGALYFLPLVVAVLLFVIGLALFNQNQTELGVVLTNMFWPINSFSMLCLGLFALEIYIQRGKQIIGTLLVASFLVQLAIYFISDTTSVTEHLFGFVYPASSGAGVFLSLATMTLISIFILIMAGLNYKKNKQGSDLFICMAILASMLTGAMGVLVTAGSPYWLFGAAVTMLTEITLLFFAIISVRHPDKDIRLDPWKMISKRLVTKVTLLTVGLFLILSLISSAAGMLLFVDKSDKEQTAEAIAAIVREKDNYYELTEKLLDDTEFLTATFRRNVIKNLPNVAVQQINDWLTHHPEITAVLVDEMGTPLLLIDDQPSAINQFGSVQGALQGKKTTSLENNFGDGWLVTAAVPVGSAKTEAVALVLTKPLPATHFQLLKSSAVNTGISTDRDLLIIGGNKPFNQHINKLDGLMSTSHELMSGQLDNTVNFHAQPLLSASGEIDGYIFQIAPVDHININIYDELLAYTLIYILISFLILLTYSFGMHMLLLPIKKLTAASNQIRRGHYKNVIDYEGDDEISEMALTFNKMSRTIEVRTKHLNEKIREQKDMINFIAHELKTPIAAVRWVLELIADDSVGNNKKERLMYVNEAMKTNERLRKLVNELLDYARLQRGAIKLKIEKLAIKKLTNDVLKELRPLARQKKITVKLLDKTKKASDIYADQGRLTQVLTNIIGNAIKYTPKNGRVTVELSGAAKNSTKVSVTDTGIGIPKNEQKHIFGKFFRANNAVASGEEGTGLGLHVTREIIKMHGGSIGFDSKANEGTTFWFTVANKKKRPKRTRS